MVTMELSCAIIVVSRNDFLALQNLTGGISMNKKMRLTAIILAIALVFTMLASSVFAANERGISVPADGEDYSGKLVVLHTNDSHGRIKEDGTSMGMSAVKYLADVYEAAGASVLILDAGDTLHGLPIVTATSVESVVDVMNRVGYDYMAPGNHDFNYGYEHLLALEDEMEFPLLAANVAYEESGENVFQSNDIYRDCRLFRRNIRPCHPRNRYKDEPPQRGRIGF